MSSSAIDHFMQESPTKVYENAQKFSKSNPMINAALGRFT